MSSSPGHSIEPVCSDSTFCGRTQCLVNDVFDPTVSIEYSLFFPSDSDITQSKSEELEASNVRRGVTVALLKMLLLLLLAVDIIVADADADRVEVDLMTPTPESARFSTLRRATPSVVFVDLPIPAKSVLRPERVWARLWRLRRRASYASVSSALFSAAVVDEVANGRCSDADADPSAVCSFCGGGGGVCVGDDVGENVEANLALMLPVKLRAIVLRAQSSTTEGAEMVVDESKARIVVFLAIDGGGSATTEGEGNFLSVNDPTP